MSITTRILTFLHGGKERSQRERKRCGLEDNKKERKKEREREREGEMERRRSERR